MAKEPAVEQRTARVGKNNRAQVVTIPLEYRFPEGMKEVFIRKVGENLVLSPRPVDWSGFLAFRPAGRRPFRRRRRLAGAGARRCMSGPCMLGTDTCAFILHRSSPTLLQRIQQVPLQAQVMSVVTLAELQYGVQLSSRKKANRTAVDALVRHLTVIDWSREAALTHLAGELHRSARGMVRSEVAYRDVLLEMSLS